MTSRGVRRIARDGEMHMKSGKSVRTPEVGKTPTRSDLIDLNDHELVIVLGGSKVVTDGPNKGLNTFSPAKIYMGGKQVGMLDSFHFSWTADNLLPEIRFSFWSKIKDEDIPKLPSSVKDALTRYLKLIQEKLPWATWTAPGSSSPTQEMTVFDPGQINPTTPESKK
jgi:hypothetical protein